MGSIGPVNFRAEAGTDRRLAARAAAIASLGAAAIHIAVLPGHWREWLPSGVFFASVAVFQLVWAILAWTRPPSVLLAAGIFANLGLAGLWVVARTAGQPFGPHAGETEAVQAAGICALLLECYVVMGALWAWFRSEERTAPVSGFSSAAVLLGANALVVTAVTVGVVSGVRGHDHSGHMPIEADRAAGWNVTDAPSSPSLGHDLDQHHHD